jgi:RNA polymerase sigma-70 factor (ECF subfamily)
MTTDDFEAAVQEHQAMVYSIARHFFRNPGVAEEIAQDVFLQLFEHRRAVSPGEHTLRWLRRATTHRCIDLARRRATHAEVAVDRLPDPPDVAADVDVMLHERLRRLVASLPETSRAVVILRYTEDLDAPEIARMLDMPVRTVWSHLQRAIALLRDKASRYLLHEDINEPVRR